MAISAVEVLVRWLCLYAWNVHVALTRGPYTWHLHVALTRGTYTWHLHVAASACE